MLKSALKETVEMIYKQCVQNESIKEIIIRSET